jgi:hypothetical protein
MAFISRTTGQLAGTPSATDISATAPTLFYNSTDPTLLYRVNAGGTAYVQVAAAGGGGGGGGTVTATGGALTANSLVLGAGGVDTKVVAGITSDGISILNLGVAGTVVGTVSFKNTVVGSSVALTPVAGSGTFVLSMPLITDTIVTKTSTDTFSNKIIDTGSSNTIKIVGNTLSASPGSATVTIPNTTDTLVARSTTDTLANKTIDTAGGNFLRVAGNTLTATTGTATIVIPNSNDTLVGRDTTDTLTHKTIDTSATNTIKIAGNTLTATTGTATLALPNSNDTLVGRVTADTLQNKIIDTGSGNTLKVNGNTLTAGAGSTTITFPVGNDTVVTLGATQTLTAKTLTAPYLANPIPGLSGGSSGSFISGLNAGATITQHQAVYMGSAGKWLIAAAGTAGAFPCRGIAAVAGTNNNPMDVLDNGVARNSTWTWTVGGDIYLSATTGALTQTQPSTSGQIVQKVGYALTATSMRVNIGAGDYATVA